MSNSLLCDKCYPTFDGVIGRLCDDCYYRQIDLYKYYFHRIDEEIEKWDENDYSDWLKIDKESE